MNQDRDNRFRKAMARAGQAEAQLAEAKDTALKYWNAAVAAEAQLAVASQALVGAEIALARDEDIMAAVQIITKARADLQQTAPTTD
jgi:hypothetical protein